MSVIRSENWRKSEQVKIKLNDERFLKFYRNYVILKFPQVAYSSKVLQNGDLGFSEKVLNTYLEQYIPVLENRLDFIHQMEVALDKVIIPENCFSWFKNNKRATFWLWGMLWYDGACNHEIYRLLNQPQNAFFYKRAELSSSPENHEARFSLIINLIDYICFTYENKYALICFLEGCLKKWRDGINSQKKIKWLIPENEDVCKWAYSYLKKYCGDTSNFPSIPSPLGVEEMYHAFYAMIDLWLVQPEKIDAFTLKINKAFYQKTFRKKQAEKKGRSVLSEKHEERLLFLVSYYKSERAAVLEMLIDDRIRGIETKLSKQGKSI